MDRDIIERVLIVDDVPSNLKILRDMLEPEGYGIMAAPNGEAALKTAAHVLPDIILLDVMMPPGIDGYEVCRRLQQNPDTAPIPVIFVTIRDETQSLAEAFQAGGVDYINKPFEKEELLARVKNHLRIKRLNQELMEKNDQLIAEIEQRKKAEEDREKAYDALAKADGKLSLISQQEAERWGIKGFIGKSKTIQGILNDIQQLQNTSTTSVLITGESGTGKELIARAIHYGGSRAKGPFIPVNCSAIPDELMESSFFGHVRGAFTGAYTSHKGYFELADGGTLFLDEIGDMPLILQSKLLRTMEDGFIMPVGGTKQRSLDIRILAATNQNVQQEISEGTFREDLYFRLARFPVKIPPLRERIEDIPLLTEHFLRMFATEMGTPQSAISVEAMKMLESYNFPGNIRELKNIMEYALIKSNGTTIKPQHLHIINAGDSVSSQAPPDKDPTNIEKAEEIMIQRARKQVDQPSGTDEEKILSYIREHGSINNSECRTILSSDRNRANYLLRKMHRYGLLKREGEQRWARYRIP